MWRNCGPILARQYPGVTFYVLPVDIVTQILNFGLSAPIDIQIVGPNLYGNRALAEQMLERGPLRSRRHRRAHPAAFNEPSLTVNVDRTRAQAIGLTQQNVAPSLLVALSGSFQTSPSFYLDPRNGVTYNVATSDAAIQTGLAWRTARACPFQRGCGSAEHQRAPGTAERGSALHGSARHVAAAEVLGNLATITPGTELGTVSHYDASRSSTSMPTWKAPIWAP